MKEMKKLLCSLLFLITGWQVTQAQDLSRFKVLSDSTYQTTEKQSDNKYKKETNIKMNKEMKFCQSCGMPLTEDVLGTNADGSKRSTSGRLLPTGRKNRPHRRQIAPYPLKLVL